MALGKNAVQVREAKAARLDAMIAASWKAHNERKEAKTMRIGIKELIQKLFLMQWDMEEVAISIAVID